jgi:L-malate glycosyltransferase
MVRKKLHVLFLNSWYPSRVLPTNGDFIQRHAECVALYHDVTAVHVITDPRMDEKRLSIEDFTENNVQTHIAYLPKTKNLLMKWWTYIRAFFVILKKVGSYDVIHLNHIYPAGLITLILAVLKGKRYIISEHWTFYHEDFRKMIKPTEKYISTVVCRQASFICPVSDELADSMKSFGLKGKYIRVPNVVDTKLFKPAAKEKSPILKLLHVSNMNDMQKNISGMLNVVARLQSEGEPFEMVMIGNNAENFRAKAKDLGIRDSTLTLINQIPHEDLITHFQQADLFIMFSEDENLPCVILESFACGTPVISTDVGGIAEYFPSSFGRLIPCDDEQALHKAILDRKDNKSIAGREEMHEYAKKHFSPESIATQFSNIYYKAIKK